MSTAAPETTHDHRLHTTTRSERMGTTRAQRRTARCPDCGGSGKIKRRITTQHGEMIRARPTADAPIPACRTTEIACGCTILGHGDPRRATPPRLGRGQGKHGFRGRTPKGKLSKPWRIPRLLAPRRTVAAAA